MTQLKETPENAKAPPSTSTPAADSGSPSGAPLTAGATAEPKGLCAALASESGEEAALIEQIGGLTVTRTSRTVPGDRTWSYRLQEDILGIGSAAKHDKGGDKQDRVGYEDDKFFPAQSW
ncbi:uncharacterized protein TRAVEDRAFT_20831 [Trametes versicolor FP-101664 SS1]|uniref:uncharacterized protein n=1 Tax=Trametes versicolor (strain FP-101664) TaxID=717944 RepID=UPI00046234B0|nr:uncharacterized protein TRAVEDRAFT_20831 [Trametes versicolor FP-101664 SS1]EIW59039.1 hypothetical protein TRAVEDRAFT_20831 [Trametes versicolor FP-101664 SS1]